jgi:hypothetical protein
MRKLLCVYVLALAACTGPAAPAREVTLARIEVTAPGDAFPLHTSLQLQVSGFFTDGHKENLTRDAVWASSDTDIVLMTNEGIATLRGAGRATVTAFVQGAQHALVLTATPVKATGVELTGDTRDVAKGQVLKLRAMASFEDGTTRDVTALAQWGTVNGNATMTEVAGEFLAARQGPVTVRAY